MAGVLEMDQKPWLHEEKRERLGENKGMREGGPDSAEQVADGKEVVGIGQKT